MLRNSPLLLFLLRVRRISPSPLTLRLLGLAVFLLTTSPVDIFLWYTTSCIYCSITPILITDNQATQRRSDFSFFCFWDFWGRRTENRDKPKHSSLLHAMPLPYFEADRWVWYGLLVLCCSAGTLSSCRMKTRSFHRYHINSASSEDLEKTGSSQ